MMNDPAFRDFVYNTFLPALWGFLGTIGTAFLALMGTIITNYLRAKTKTAEAHAKSAELDTNQKVAVAAAVGVDQSHPDAPNEVKKQMATEVVKEKAVGNPSDKSVDNLVEQGVAIKKQVAKAANKDEVSPDVEVNVSNTKNTNV